MHNTLKGVLIALRLTAASGVALSAFLVATPACAQGSYPTPSGDRVDANGMPTTHSTPAEKAQTTDLNNQVSSANHAADAQSDDNNAQYQAQHQEYRDQLQQNQAEKHQYQEQTAP
jgi:hypothetical protein